MRIREYRRPDTLEEAYALLTKGRANRILGGTTFLGRTHMKIGVAIDLAGCGLDYIRDEGDHVAIGAYTSLRSVETSELLLETFGTALREPPEHLIGVQLRNLITVGGHVASRFGFSDLIPVLLALNASVRFYHRGVRTLRDYLRMEHVEKDILVEVLLPKEGRRCVVQMMRRSYNDYSIFCLAVSRAGSDWIVAGGVFPGRARAAEKTMEQMKGRPVTRQDAPELAERIAAEFSFGSNYRGTAEYRRDLCRVFARRALEALADAD